ncbi:hypothetical protein LEP1GSC035_2088 [Leptospira noguchii str. 2007001578]|uniref:Uncharacterized protein n=2 Tax=Leptospira noguchii TaxID=28182 RepID=M6YA07_9LEPT|nr:hypothetical protein LEP1GSC035_2088 [Leptospira noguchii str. 2007001578]EMO88706.1 hypothetical protein LEP1GSC024_4915 [Leptospira noguchii str. 2001034031]
MFEILDKCIVWLDDFGLLYNFNIIFQKQDIKLKLPMKIPLELLKN